MQLSTELMFTMRLESVGGALSTFILLLAAQSDVARGHGRLIEPPSRASMWRYGFDTPPDYDDTALYCGGYSVQWEINGGKCGVCGDRYDRAREHEAGGKYANGIIVRHYREGETITVSVELTTSHLGYFEFKICPNNNPARAVTQRCLDRHLLKQPDGSTRYTITTYDQRVHSVRLVLPPGLTCTQCVLQWKYNTGNSWRCDGVGAMRRCCDGCGPQEQFYGCADVDVRSSSGAGGNLSPVHSTSLQSPDRFGQGTQILNPTSNKNPPSGHYYVNPTFGASQQYPQSNLFYQYVRPANGQYVPNPQTPPPSKYQFFFGSNLNSPQSSASSSYYYSRCRGITESLTDYCRRNCRSGFCSRVYCTETCQWLRSYSDRPEEN